jgi:hypothetical protein
MLLKVCMGSVFESATLDEVYLSAVFLGRFSSMLLDGSFYHSNTRFFFFVIAYAYFVTATNTLG